MFHARVALCCQEIHSHTNGNKPASIIVSPLKFETNAKGHTMTIHTQKTDRDSQWAMTSSNDTWILTKNAEIETSGMPGVYEGNGVENSNIRILGDVKTSGGGTYAVSFQDDSSSVYVGKASHIDGRAAFAGMAMNGGGTEIVNHGLVQGGTIGVYGTAWGSVENHGTVTGDTGI
ncbi:MAG: hypothetical protein JWL86_408 [Rhizobium sp.]|nr:hypothetical protein [Rhizobium sp.]